MEILDIIRTRRSIRRFTSTPVEEGDIDRVLEAGRWAPSGLNNQPWRFAVIRDRELIGKISALTHYARIVLSASVLIPVFLDRAGSYHREKDIQAIGACLQNMLLEAHGLGLGCVWLGEIIKNSDPIKGLLGLGSSELELMAVVAVGHPAESPKSPARKDIRELIVFRG